MNKTSSHKDHGQASAAIGHRASTSSTGHRQRPGRNANYPKNPRGGHWEHCIQASAEKIRAPRDATSLVLFVKDRKQNKYVHVIFLKSRHVSEKLTSPLQDKHHLTDSVCFQVIYYTPHVFLWVWDYFQCDLYLLKCQDKHGAGGDLCLSWMSAPLATNVCGDIEQERKNRRRRRHDLCWCWLLTYSRCLSLSFLSSLPTFCHLSLSPFSSLVSHCLVLSFLAFFCIHAHKHPLCELKFVSMHRQTATQRFDEKENGRRLQTIKEGAN